MDPTSPNKSLKTEEDTNSDDSPQRLGIMKLNNHKAGMEGLDTDKINQIIESASKGSKFYLHKQKSQERINKKILELESALAKLTEDQRASARLKMDNYAAKLEETRDLSRTIVHIDMDAFYAAVEMRDAPHLREVPMAVGSNSMLSTSNYHARKFGVRAGMPGFIGKKLCPKLVIVPTNFEKYTRISREVQRIFADYDPEFSAASLDEAYLDLTHFLAAQEEPVTAAEAVEQMRRRIKEETQLTASAGIAANGMLAKVCSDLNKPNGQFVLANNRQDVMDFIGSLPIRKISGIGNVTEQMLSALDITTCQDLWQKRDLLSLLFSENSCDHFMRIALGLGSDSSGGGGERSERKSVSCETTFRATSQLEELKRIVCQLSGDLAQDLLRHRVVGRSVTLKYKTEGFDVKTRVSQLNESTADAAVIEKTAVKILTNEAEGANRKHQVLTLRLLGVRMSQLTPLEHHHQQQQLTLNRLFECPSKKRKLAAGSAAGSQWGSQAGSQAGSGPEAEATFTCPVCGSWKTNDSEVDLNRHIDECLNQQVIDASSTSTSSTTASVKRKSQTNLDRFIIKHK